MATAASDKAFSDSNTPEFKAFESKVSESKPKASESKASVSKQVSSATDAHTTEGLNPDEFDELANTDAVKTANASSQTVKSQAAKDSTTKHSTTKHSNNKPKKAASKKEAQKKANPAVDKNDKKTRLNHLIKRMPNLPGVYKMLDKNGDILYVGKAKSLKNRVNSYFAKTIDHPKTRALVQRIHHIDTIITRSETEALLLEQNLIKEYRPPYNVLLRDDKSYLYVFISADKPYPRLAYGRGKGNHQKGRFFAISLSHCRKRDAGAIAKNVSNAPVQQHVFSPTSAPVFGVSNQALPSALRGLGVTGRLRRRRTQHHPVFKRRLKRHPHHLNQ